MAVLASLLLAFALAAPAAASTPASVSLLDGQAVVPGGSYVAFRVPADENPSLTGVLVGKLKGDESRFAVAVLTQSDFRSWKMGYSAYPLYSVHRAAQVDVRAKLPRPDVYYLVISNPYSPTQASTIHGTLRLLWVPATQTVLSTRGADVGRDLVSFGFVVLLAGALALWSILEGREVQPVAEERAA